MDIKVWNLMYALGNTDRIFGALQAVNRFRRLELAAMEEDLGLNG